MIICREIEYGNTSKSSHISEPVIKIAVREEVNQNTDGIQKEATVHV